MRTLLLYTTILISALYSSATADDAAGTTGNVAVTATTGASTDSVKPKPTRRYYMEIQGIQGQVTTRALEIKFVAGELFHNYTKTSTADLQRFRDKYKFSTMVDALNMMSLMGWQLSDCYTSASAGTVITHWVIYKEADNAEDLAAGIVVKSDK